MIKHHGGPYGRAGVPDIYVQAEGLSLWIELKGKHGKVSEIQRRVIRRINSCGGTAIVLRVSDESGDIYAAIEDADGSLIGRICKGESVLTKLRLMIPLNRQANDSAV